MTSKEILEKAIAQAVEGGWLPTTKPRLTSLEGNTATLLGDKPFEVPVERLLFDHDFAKAFWNTPTVTVTPKLLCRAHGQFQCDTDYCHRYGKFLGEYEYHLQQQVLLPTTEERIKHLEKGLK